MKRFTIILLLLITAFQPCVQAAFAQSPTTAAGIPQAGGNGANARAARQADRMESLRSRAEQEIDRRITSLTTVLTKLGEIKKLSDSTKTSLATQVQSAITNLTDLKTKIQADTDLETLRTDVQSVVTSYRVYALFIPQIHILAAADRMSTIADKMTEMTTKIQSRITETQSAGKDVTALQASLTDMQTKITDANTQILNAQTSVSALTPEGYPGNKSTLQTARTSLQTARKDLMDAKQDAKTILQTLKTSRTGTTTTPVGTDSGQPAL